MPFVDYSKSEPCMSREHQPPMHISLKPGTYVWECPACGLRQVVRVPGIIYQPS